MAYVDTNVLIAAYAPRDPLHKASKAFLEKGEEPRVISPLTFGELNSVIARTEESLQLPAILAREPSARRVRAIVEYMIRDSRTILASGLGFTRIHVGGKSVSAATEFWEASRLAPVLRLHALDLIHLAYAHLIGRLEFAISTFVTGDRGIISKADEIEKSLEIVVKHPREVI